MTRPTQYTFTLEDVWKKAVEVVRHYPDRIHLGTVYFGHQGQCNCLFGFVLKGLGVAVWDVEEGQLIDAVLYGLIGVRYTDENAPLLRKLTALQTYADSRHPRVTWSEALAKVKADHE